MLGIQVNVDRNAYVSSRVAAELLDLSAELADRALQRRLQDRPNDPWLKRVHGEWVAPLSWWDSVCAMQLSEDRTGDPLAHIPRIDWTKEKPEDERQEDRLLATLDRALKRMPSDATKLNHED